MVIDHGRLMYDGALGGLHEIGESERTLVVDLERELPPIDGIEGARTVRTEGPRQWIAFPASASAAPIVSRIADGVSAGRPVGAGAGHRGRHRPYVHGPLRRGAGGSGWAARSCAAASVRSWRARIP